MDSGTFKGCSVCKEVPDCCSNFKRIDNPVLSENEVTEIEMIYNIHDFYEKKKNGTFCIKSNEQGHCVFFLNKGCAIYAHRPDDCKLFPYDVIREGDSYYLVLYKIHCIDDEYFSSEQEVDRIMPVVNNIMHWIDAFADETNFERMGDLPYKVLRRVK